MAVKKTENLNIRISPEVKAILQKQAAKLGMSDSEYVRLLILVDAKQVLRNDEAGED